MSYVSRHTALIRSTKATLADYDVPRLLASGRALPRRVAEPGRAPFSTNDLERALTETKYPPQIVTDDARLRAAQLRGLEAHAIRVMAAYEFQRIRQLCGEWSAMDNRQKRPYRELAEARSYSAIRESMLGSMRARNARDAAIEEKRQSVMRKMAEDRRRKEIAIRREALRREEVDHKARLGLAIDIQQRIAEKERKRIQGIEKSLMKSASRIIEKRKEMKKSKAILSKVRSRVDTRSIVIKRNASNKIKSDKLRKIRSISNHKRKNTDRTKFSRKAKSDYNLKFSTSRRH